jgi:tetratricopeptide (TPR) repeat protein
MSIHGSKTRRLCLALMVVPLLLAACSAEQRKQRYIERGQEYLQAEQFEQAGIEFRNAAQIDPQDAQARFLVGQAAERLGKVRDAAGHYLAALDIDTAHPGARAAMARMYALGGIPDKAMALVEPGLAQDPDDAELLTVRAVVQLQRGDTAAALRDAERAHGLAPENQNAVALLASLYAQGGQRDKAIAVVNEIIERHPLDVELNVVLADLYHAAGDARSAEAALRRAMQADPKALPGRLRLVRFLLLQKNADAAEALLREGVALTPEDPQVKLALVELLAGLRGAAAAEAEIQRMLVGKRDDDELRLVLAGFHERLEHLEQAAADYQAVIAHAGTRPAGLTARNRLAAMAMRRERLDEADRLVREVLAENPGDADALTLRGNLALARGQVDAAITDLRAVLRDQPKAAAVARALARAHDRKGEGSLAEETLRAALQANPGDAGLRLDLASLLAQSGRAALARPLLVALAREKPGDLGVLRALFAVQQAEKDHAGAVATAQEIQRLAPRSSLGAYLAGQAASAQGDTAAALESYERALQLQPTATEPLAEIVKVLLQRRQIDAAAQRVQQALAAYPGNAALHMMRGEIDVMAARQAAAITAFKEASRLSPAWWKPYRGEAIALLASGQAEQAIAALRTGVERSGHSAELVTDLASLLERQGRPAEAIRLYEAAVARDERQAFAVNNLAMLLANYGAAEADIARALGLVEKLAGSVDPGVLDTRGWVKLKAGQVTEAVTLLQKAADGLPEAPAVRYHLAKAQLQSGDSAAARRNLERALASEHPFHGRDDARRTLDGLKGRG